MARVTVNETSLENIGDAIRAKLNVETEYKPSQMAAAIRSIEKTDLESLSATVNGTYLPTSGHNGFSRAVVNVPNSYSVGDEGKVVSNGALVPQTSATKTENGTYDTTLNNEIVVNVPQGATPTGNINITTMQQTDVTNYATAQVVDANLVAGNIKKDVDILGVVGTYEGSGGGVPSWIVPKYAEDFDGGYINSGQFFYGQSSAYAMDVWQVLASHYYFIILGIPTGNRFRNMFTTIDITNVSENVVGSQIGSDLSITDHESVPRGGPTFANAMIGYLAPSNGYLCCFKSNDSHKNVPCMLIDLTEMDNNIIREVIPSASGNSF